MSQRWDIEFAAAEALAAYLTANVDAAILTACPVVTFYDPMSQDEDHRIVVSVAQATTYEGSPGTCEVDLEVGVKSTWGQPTLATDRAAHFERLNAVRAALACSLEDLNAGLEAAGVEGIGFSGVSTVRTMRSEVSDGWFYSQTDLKIHCYTKETDNGE